MTTPHQPSPGSVETATCVLAGALTRALQEDGDAFGVSRSLGAWGDRTGGLAAVRVLGADVLTPFVLTGRPLPAEDAALVRTAVRAHPAPRHQPLEAALWGARDAALVRALAALGVDGADWEGLAPASPSPDGLAADWMSLTAVLVPLASAAHPFTDTALRTQLAGRRLDLSRGLVRALLRRDLLSAARMARWLVLDASATVPDLVGPALEHLATLGADDPRVQLEVAVARRLTARARC
ncbi:hypothetical protein [Streptomyces clavuligerus]|uniref:Uncharacterized protein n=1 Tax=Streptomyces clavuligerus TaxID=1901 RepID=B5GQI7_STRCL|nr:hypothetical protein [Streptomyces clavuligerus]ANW20325.1 hypothetical protein BB341_19995 [Streptomyces clavuligerus]AXU14951.1 hypothetical protein D1794_20820 [Streptomyces clavuligerus]EDY48583.1 hypothetical protein SSCG_01611 [Streptomyces clavuligerus]EFG06730.1 Hypothetical protein SCLAV_1655 [Streptomyces clavuligerus]MBY6305000.1 hypothetical protein [Streptomyces clavuligerus]